MHKIGIIGDYESICGFAAIGFDTVYVNSRDEAKEKLRVMLKDDYCIIYVTSDFFFEVNSDNSAVMPLPDKNNPVGSERIAKFTEKAVGSRI